VRSSEKFKKEKQMNAYHVAKKIEKYLKETHTWSTAEGLTPALAKGKQATLEHGYFDARYGCLASIVWEEGLWVEELQEKYVNSGVYWTIPWVNSEAIRDIADKHGYFVEPYNSWLLGVFPK
jgi:hypothetical protein